MTVAFVPPRVPLVDPRTGTITREWYLLLSGLFTANGLDIDELMMVAPSNGGDAALYSLLGQAEDRLSLVPAATPPLVVSDNLSPASVPLFIAADDVLPLIGALRDQVAALTRDMEDLRKGTIVL